MAKRRKKKLPKVVYRKLGREKAFGLYWADPNNPIIELDHRMKGKRHLEVLLHEALHHYFPEFSETKVERVAYFLRDILWREGYREVIMK